MDFSLIFSEVLLGGIWRILLSHLSKEEKDAEAVELPRTNSHSFEAMGGAAA